MQRARGMHAEDAMLHAEGATLQHEGCSMWRALQLGALSTMQHAVEHASGERRSQAGC
jgi:hypothetical protein